MNMNYQNSANPYGFAQPRKRLNWTQPLTAEERQMLRKHTPEFSLVPDQLDLIRAKCTHRDPKTYTTTLVENADGSYTCTECGSTFNLVDISKEDVERCVATIVDVLQSAKTMFVDMNPAAVQEYFQLIPLIEKLPKLYEIAVKTFSDDMGGSNIQPGYYANSNPWQMMNQYFGGGIGMMPQYQQPYYQQAPQMQQMPMPNNYGYGGYQGNPIQAGYQPNPQQTYYQPVDQYYQDTHAASNLREPQPVQNQPASQPATPAVPASAPGIANNNQQDTVTSNKRFNL